MYYSSQQSGFTLIEMLIAVLIFSLSLVALMTIASRSIQSNRAAQDEIIAQYLAAEGIEGVRHIRDTNFVSGQDWLTGIDQCIGGSCHLRLNSSLPDSGAEALYNLATCESNCGPLMLDDNRYGMDTGDLTNFTRTITFQQGSDNVISVASRVDWMQGRASRSITMESLLTNWQIAP